MEGMSTKQLPKSLRKLKPVLREQDWAYEATSKGHIAIMDAAGRTVTHAAGTASDWRSTRNMLAILKRNGLVLPPGFKLD